MEFVRVQPVEVAFIGRGIYRLYDIVNGKREVVYVGQAACISGRIHVHRAEGEKAFSAFDYVLLPDVSKAELDLLEAREIFRLKPRYNRTLPPTGKHKRLGQIAYLLGVRPMKLQRYIDEHRIECFLGKYDIGHFEGVSL